MDEMYEVVKEGTRTLLIREVDELERDAPIFSEKITIHGLLSGSRRFRDGREYMFYEISGKRRLSEIYEQQSISCANLKELLLSIQSIRDRLYEYLLPEYAIILDPDYIFLSSDLTQYYYLYQEQENEEFARNLRNLSEFLITHASHEDPEAVALSYRFFSDAACECINIHDILERSARDVVQRSENEEQIVKAKEKTPAKEPAKKGKVRLIQSLQKEKKKPDEEKEKKKPDKSILTGIILPIVPAFLMLGAYFYFPSRSSLILAVLITYLGGFGLYLIGKIRKNKQKLTQESE